MATAPLSRVVEHLRRVAFIHESAGLSDAQLLDSFLTRREDAAFEALVRRHGPMILGVCRRILRDRHDAEDAFQATFLVLIRKAASIGKRELLANWVYGVAHRTALKTRKGAARRRAKERQVYDMAQVPVTRDEAIENMLPLLDQELSRLPNKYRVPIILCDLEGKTRRAAAQQLNLGEKTFSTRLDRARAMLAKRLTRQGTTISGSAVALAVSQNMASAAVPPSLVASTVKIGTLVAAAKTGPAVAISAKVAALTEGVVKAMLLTKLKIMTAVLAVTGMIALGGGFVVHRTAEISAANDVKTDTPSAMASAAQKPKLRDTLKGHTASVTSLAFSPDGKTLASASTTIKLWELVTGKVQGEFTGHSGPVYSVVFSPDGKTLASASEDKTVKLWDVGTGRELATLKGHTDFVRSLAYSPDGKTLASGSFDGTIKLWDGATGKERETLIYGTLIVLSLTYSPDGKNLAAGGWEQNIKIWDVSTNKVTATIKTNWHQMDALAFSRDSKTLAWGGQDATIFLSDVSTGKEKGALKGHTAFLLSLTFSPDGRTLASGSYDKTVKLWELPTNKVRATLKGHTEPVNFVAYSPDGRTLASASGDKTIKLWDVPTAQEASKPKHADGQKTKPQQKEQEAPGYIEVSGQTVNNQQTGEKPQRKTEKRSGEVELQGIDLAKRTIKVVEGKRRIQPKKGEPNIGELWSNWELLITPTTKITVDGKDAQLADLQAVYPIWVNVEWQFETSDELKNGTRLLTIFSETARAIRVTAPRIRVEGVVYGINKNTIITKLDMKDSSPQSTYYFAKNIEVVIDGKKAGTTDLKAQMSVSLKLSLLNKEHVVAITAAGPEVTGVIKAVNAEKHTISVNIPSARVTTEAIAVAKDAMVAMDGDFCEFSLLQPGMPVTLQMSAEPEQSLVIGITATKVAKEK